MPASQAQGGGRTIRGRGHSPIRSWPLLVLALPASVAVWSGWVGIGQMTGFGIVRPLPGIWDSLRVDTAVTLPVGVEAYAAMALHAWLARGHLLSVRTRRFARWSAIGSLTLGAAGQVAYHLLAEAHVTRAPWQVTTLVASLPVIVLGLGTALAHMLRADATARTIGPEHVEAGPVRSAPGQKPAGPTAGLVSDKGHDTDWRHRLVPAAAGPQGPGTRDIRATANALIAAGQRVSRRSLRSAGIHGSNAELGELARWLRAETEGEEHQAA